MWLFARIEMPWMFLVGVVLMIFILMRRWFRYSRRQRKRPDRYSLEKVKKITSSAEPNLDLPLVDSPPEMTRWHVEMYEVARDIKGELNSKMIALQEMVRMADQASQRLESAVKRAESLGIRQSGESLEEIQHLTQLSASADDLCTATQKKIDHLPPLPSETEGK